MNMLRAKKPEAVQKRDFVPLTIRGKVAVVHLSMGFHTIIDIEAWFIVGRHIWHAKVCRSGNIYAVSAGLKGIKLHGLICPAGAGRVPDHINRNSLDNRAENLRAATFQQNCANGKARKNSTGYRGSYWDKCKCRFVSKIMLEGKLKHLGDFDNAVDAARAYDVAARKVYGEFAVLNFPEREAQNAA